MEFPEGWGFNLKKLPWEGYGYFLEQHNVHAVYILHTDTVHVALTADLHLLNMSILHISSVIIAT